MNSQAAKARRWEMRNKLGLDPTQCKWEVTTYGTTRHWVPAVGGFLWIQVPVDVTAHTISLHPGCGRAIYKRAKALVKVDKRRKTC